MRSLLLSVLVAGALLLGRGARADSADVQALLAEVGSLVAPNALPGPIASFGPGAFPVVVAGPAGRQVPVIAATRWQRGRIVALGHEGFLSGAALGRAGNARFLANAARWVSAGHPGAVVVVVDNPPAAAALEQAGIKVARLSVDALREQMEAPDFEAVVLDTAALDGREGKRLGEFITAFVRRGGGAILTSLGWGWLQVHPGQRLAIQHGGNQVTAPMGLAWTDGYAEADNGSWRADGQGLDATDSRLALQTLWRHADGTAKQEDTALAQAVQAVSLPLPALPAQEGWFTSRVADLCRKYAADAKPPVSLSQPVARLQVALDGRTQWLRGPEKATAHPWAALFPGPVPANAPRIERTETLDTAIRGWRSLGVYAAPGETITVSVPASAVGAGLALQIGAHTDTLWHLDRWDRYPDIVVRREIRAQSVKLASPFGGLVYVDIPDSAPAVSLSVKVSGAVEAPRFVQGVTTKEEWLKLRDAPGPWAELVGRRMILTVPSSVVRALDDPEGVTAFWDEAADSAAQLYARPVERPRPERFVIDRQISAGYMHSGYPIMTGDDVAAAIVDIKVLRGKDSRAVWGFHHELGHNHQRDAWTFDGTGEVTNNLLALYNTEKFNGVRVAPHPALEPAAVQDRVAKYRAEGMPFDKWKADPFLALQFYRDLREGFGWEAFTKVFAGYAATPEAELPRTDDEKRDQWLIRFSRTVNKNLAPFFDSWGVPISAAARNAVSRLPRWMPPGASPP